MAIEAHRGDERYGHDHHRGYVEPGGPGHPAHDSSHSLLLTRFPWQL